MDPDIFTIALGALLASSFGAAIGGSATRVARFVREDVAQAAGRLSFFVRASTLPLLLVVLGAVLQIPAVVFAFSTSLAESFRQQPLLSGAFLFLLVFASASLWIGPALRNSLTRTLRVRWMAVAISLALPIAATALAWWCAYSVWAVK